MRRVPLRRGGQLERRTPLRSRTTLPRGASPARTTPMPARSAPLRARSAKTAALYRQQRAPLVAEVCARPCAGAVLLPDVRCWGPIDPHEPLTRARGGSIVDPDNVVALCRGHHQHVHDVDPARAHEVGLLRHSWDREAAG